MSAWVNQELNLEGLRHQPTEEEAEQARAWFNALDVPLAREIASAEHGDIEPLRAALPHLAKFLQLPKLPPGETWSNLANEHVPVVLMAAHDVPRIRALWQLHYNKKNRRAGDVTAEEIAAARWGVDVEDVISRLKKI
jgi:hypothetical protein